MSNGQNNLFVHYQTLCRNIYGYVRFSERLDMTPVETTLSRNIVDSLKGTTTFEVTRVCNRSDIKEQNDGA